MTATSSCRGNEQKEMAAPLHGGGQDHFSAHAPCQGNQQNACSTRQEWTTAIVKGIIDRIGSDRSYGGLMDSTAPHISLIGKALRLPLRMIPSGTQMPILRGPMRGKRWIVGSTNHGCWLGIYERSKLKVFSAAIQRGYVVYDLGANVGFYSLLASVLVGSDGQVFSFEPAPRNLGLLRRHLELNRVKNCSVLTLLSAVQMGQRVSISGQTITWAARQGIRITRSECVRSP